MTFGRIIIIGILLTVIKAGMMFLMDSHNKQRELIGKRISIDGNTVMITAILEGSYILSNNTSINHDLAHKLVIKNSVTM